MFRAPDQLLPGKWPTLSQDRNHSIRASKQHGLDGDLVWAIRRLKPEPHMRHHRRRLCNVRLLNKRRQIVGSNKQQEGLADNLLGINLQD